MARLRPAQQGLLCLLAVASAAAVSPCQPLGLAVDGHRVRRAMEASQRPTYSWQLPSVSTTAADQAGQGGSSAACTHQAAYQVQIADRAGTVLFDSGRVNVSISDGVRLLQTLPPMRELAFRVRVWAGSNTAVAPVQPASAWSQPCQFATQMSSDVLSQVLPLWSAPPPAGPAAVTSPGPPARFAMLRGTFDCTWAGSSSTFLMLSAKPTPNWKADPPRGNASKLLGAYKAWLNGVPLGVGPGRTYAQGVGVVRKTPLFEPF